MSGIAELFGLDCRREEAPFAEAVRRQTCPFRGGGCVKTRKSRPSVAIGTCTVDYRGERIIICPFRLLESRQVFLDCLHLLTAHEPGNQLYVVPEVAIPGGNVDYFLVSARDGRVMDFAGIELQTMDTTGTVWPERQRFLAERGLHVPKRDIARAKPFGMNWKMTAKTILVQMHHKTRTFEHLGKHLVLVVQKPLLDYMTRAFAFSHVRGVRLGDAVHIHSYTLEGAHPGLALHSRASTDSAGIAQCLGLQAEAKVELAGVIALLESKLKEDYRLTV